MPVLAACFGYSGAYFLIETPKNKKSEFNFVTFPYTYIPAICGDYCDSKKFNTSLMEKIAGDFGAKLSDFDILITDVYDYPRVTFEPTQFVTLNRLFQATSGPYPIYVSNHSVRTKKAAIGINLLKGVETQSGHENFELNFGKIFSPNELEYIYNHEIYPQISAVDLSTRIDLDRNIVNMVTKETDIGISADSNQLIFMGARFIDRILDPELDYVLALDFIQNPGVYSVYIDRNNAFILLSLLSLHKTDAEINFDKYLEKAGTVIRTHGETECLIKSGSSTGQIFTLIENEVFVVPLDENSMAEVQVRGSHVEKGVVANVKKRPHLR